MDYKKMFGIILILIFGMFALMLSTSYAWYSFQGAATEFSATTNNDSVIIDYLKGEYINTSTSIPVSEEEIDKYSDKNNFTIRVKNNKEDNELVASIALVDVSIDSALQNNSFKVDLYHQGELLKSFNGSNFTSDTINLDNVVLDNSIDNNFEVRVYILDNGQDQTVMMNKSFRGKIKLDVISRVKTEFNDFVDPDISITSIIIDGESSKYLPTNGYYNMSSTCSKGSSLSWDSLSKTIIYGKGSYINDSCSLTFTSSTNYPRLNTMGIGSYVKYTGSNGCSGKRCNGENANYVNDSDMGYCGSSNNKFTTSGWRVAYIKDGSVYLVSAGALECYKGDVDDGLNLMENLNRISLRYCNKSYAYGGVCNNTSSWVINGTDFSSIMGSTLGNSSCYISSSDKSCGYSNDLIDNGSNYWYGIVDTGDSKSLLYWDAVYRNNRSGIANSSDKGVRPILRLRDDVVVTGGSGTRNDPYVIK